MGINGRQRVKTDKGKEVTCSVPTLSEYVTLTPRMVTPVSVICRISPDHC